MKEREKERERKKEKEDRKRIRERERKKEETRLSPTLMVCRRGEKNELNWYTPKLRRPYITHSSDVP